MDILVQPALKRPKLPSLNLGIQVWDVNLGLGEDLCAEEEERSWTQQQGLGDHFLSCLSLLLLQDQVFSRKCLMDS